VEWNPVPLQGNDLLDWASEVAWLSSDDLVSQLPQILQFTNRNRPAVSECVLLLHIGVNNSSNQSRRSKSWWPHAPAFSKSATLSIIGSWCVDIERQGSWCIVVNWMNTLGQNVLPILHGKLFHQILLYAIWGNYMKPVEGNEKLMRFEREWKWKWRWRWRWRWKITGKMGGAIGVRLGFDQAQQCGIRAEGILPASRSIPQGFYEYYSQLR